MQDRATKIPTDGSCPAVGHGAGVSGNELSGDEPGGAVGAVLREETGQVVQSLEPVYVVCTRHVNLSHVQCSTYV